MSRISWMAALVGAGVLAGVTAGAQSSEAAFPGKNGLIAFQSFHDGYAQIYTTTDGGTEPKPVKRRRDCYALPAWSRDGKQIAFEFNDDTAGRPARRSEIYVMNADGTGTPRRLTKNAVFDGDPSWSPDGRYLVFESQRDGNSELYRLDVKTLKVKRLTNDPAFDGDPVWSPFGNGIAFTSTRTGNREIFLMRFDGSQPLNLTNNRASDFDPSWAPNGELVTFVSDRDGNLDIYATNDRFLLRRLTAHPSLDAFPAWSPDAKFIVFVSDRSDPGNRDLYVMKSDGTGIPKRLTDSPNWDVAPDWSSVPPGVPGKPLGPARAQPRGDRTSAIACVVVK